MPAQSTDGPAADATGTAEVVSPVESTPPSGTEHTEAAPADGGENPQDDGTPDKANREAARYRTQLRETESQRDGLAAQLDALRRAEIARLAGDRLARGDELFVHRGEDVAGLLAEGGAVDPAKVTEAVTELLTERPHLAKRRFQGSADGGARSPATPPPRLGAIFSREGR